MATKIRTSDAVLDAQHIGNACGSRHGDTGESDAVGALVSALATKIRTSMRYWMLKLLVLLWSARMRDTGESDGRSIVSALATKIRTSDAVLNAQAIGNACYGLQGMRDTVSDLEHWYLYYQDPYIGCVLNANYWYAAMVCKA